MLLFSNVCRCFLMSYIGQETWKAVSVLCPKIKEIDPAIHCLNSCLARWGYLTVSHKGAHILLLDFLYVKVFGIILFFALFLIKLHRKHEVGVALIKGRHNKCIWEKNMASMSNFPRRNETRKSIARILEILYNTHHYFGKLNILFRQVEKW